uniref:Aldo_ket_red domain-containing protein n=1 Tax=Rhabditophanes sp. KR3021 TaxID=114890 RepID=A0AC35U031_9BILA
MESFSDEKVELADGVMMPISGFNTLHTKEENVKAAVDMFMDKGIRCIHIENSAKNLEAVGKAVSDYCATHNLTRQDIFYVLWLSIEEIWSSEEPDIFVADYLKQANLEYVDLIILRNDILILEENDKSTVPYKLAGTWRSMEKYYELKYTKSIAISHMQSTNAEIILNCATVKMKAFFVINNSNMSLNLSKKFCQQQKIPCINHYWNTVPDEKVITSENIRGAFYSRNRTPSIYMTRLP